MFCLNNEDFVRIELKPQVKDCIVCWIEDNYDYNDCLTCDSMCEDDIEDFAELELPEELITICVDAVNHLIQECVAEYDIDNTPIVEYNDDFVEIVQDIWFHERDVYTQKMYDDLEKQIYNFTEDYD